MPDPARLPEFIARLVEALGPKGVSTDQSEIQPLTEDWRGRWKGSTPVLVKPASTEEVSDAVKLCAEFGYAITPQGGNSGMVNGSVPYGEVLISLRRMNQVREVDILNDAMTVEAGVILASAQDTAAQNGRFFPVSLGAEGVATIGGLISTNAGGVNVLRYGMMREQVLGIEAVLPDGTIWNGLRGLRKDNTGYDLKQLFIGAEGTLGIVTAATLKLYPQPAAKATAWVAVESPGHAVVLLAHAKAFSGGAVSCFELISDRCMQLVLKHIPGTRDPLPPPEGQEPGKAPWRVLMELSLPRAEGAREIIEELLGLALERELALDAVFADNEAQANLLWKIRESIPLAEKSEGKALKHDVSVPVSRIAEFLARGDFVVQDATPGATIVAFGHVGDGNMHYNVLPPPGVDATAFVESGGLAATHAVYDLVLSLNGSISAEHGIGRLKVDELAARKSFAEMTMMRAVKQALDPENRMNPGRVLGLFH